MGQINRRQILGGTAGVAALAKRGFAADTESSSPKYYVGIATNQQVGYDGARRAIAALPPGEFPDVAGRSVVVKVNLVLDKVYTTGATTDPSVCQAVVDLCLQNGATHVSIVEASQISKSGKSVPPPWRDCGYTALFADYSNVTLVDLDQDPVVVVPVPNSYIYQQVFIPQSLVGNPVMISCAALKTHMWSGVTLSFKNFFGLFLPKEYAVLGFISRGDPHLMSINQSLCDINSAVPCQFAVIGGIYGMEGNGPWNGPTVNPGVVLAGRNQVAVDRLAMQMMGITFPVLHLDLAASKGMGPKANQVASQVITVGDPPQALSFIWPLLTWPYYGVPGLSASSIKTGSGLTAISKWLESCSAMVEIIAHDQSTDTSNSSPVNRVTQIKVLAAWANYQTNTTQSFAWDGTDNFGAIVQPGTYFVRVSTRFSTSDTQPGQMNYGSTIFTVTD